MNTKTGKLISKLRKEKKLTQQELADKLAVSPKTISKWECGNGLPDISYLKNISEIFEITIEELLEGEIKKGKQTKKNNKVLITIIILIIIGIISLMIINNLNKEKNISNKNITYNCELIKTYYIDNISKSNNENYLYVTIHEFQVEGTYTIKLPKTISEKLESEKSYEFTFKTKKEYINSQTTELFSNSEIINIIYTDKEGLERTNKYTCS